MPANRAFETGAATLLAALLLSAVLLWAVPALADRPPPEPGHAYRVVGVGAGDVLNVRARPGTGGEIIGTLPPDATDVIVTGVRRETGNGAWWEILHEASETAEGWVNARFLERLDVHAAPETEFPLNCIGTEPFWGMRIAKGQALFSAPGVDGIERRAWSASPWIAAVPGRRFAVRLEGGEGASPGWAAILRASPSCSDGMSDSEYPYDVLMVTPTGEARAGCCRRAP